MKIGCKSCEPILWSFFEHPRTQAYEQAGKRQAQKQASRIKAYFESNWEFASRYKYVKLIGNGEQGVAVLMKQKANPNDLREERFFVIKRGLGGEGDKVPNEIHWLQVSANSQRALLLFNFVLVTRFSWLMTLFHLFSDCGAQRISCRW